MKRFFLFLFLCGAVGFASEARAALLYLDIPEDTYQEGDTFVAKIRLDNETVCINAAEVNLRFPKDVIRAIDVSRGESIFTLWVDEPVVHEADGTISFSGGIPGGYCGRVAGDPGVSNILAKIVFTVPQVKAGNAPFKGVIQFLPGTKVLLNDGFGTEALLTTQDREVSVTTGIAAPKNEWARELLKDTIPPEFFSLELRKDASMFGKKYFIIFSTTDKQSGLDHYEVLEERRPGSQEEKKAMWKRIESPYALADQRLQSVIKVKAIDKAGNERVAEYVPSVDNSGATGIARLIAVFAAIIAGVCVMYVIIRKKYHHEA